MADTANNLKHRWLNVSIPIITFVVGVISAAYILGQRTGKVQEILDWKAETAPRIERFDSSGTLSFKFFQENYKDEQAKQYKRLEALEGEVKHIESLTLRVDRIERRMEKSP
jgi:hypothetical protein